jgi:hypothetical protein
MDIDTDIDNYQLIDMLNLFKVSNKLTTEEINKINNTTNKLEFALIDNDELNPDIYRLFKKVSIILKCLNKYRDYLIIKDGNYIPTKKDDNNLIFYIKNTENFEDTNDINFLLNKIIKNNKTIDYQNEDTAYPIVLDNLINKINNTFENRVVSGDINSIKRITKLVNVHIDSCFRDKYYNSNPCNFIYNLPKQFKNVISMKLASIEIPNSWYLFTDCKKNNAFVIQMTDVINECNGYKILIPNGNYDNATLTEFLNSTYFFESGTTTLLQYIKFSINEYTNRTHFELTGSPPDGTAFSIFFTDENTDNMLETSGWILGFRLAKYLDIQTTLISEGLFDSGGDRYIYLTINDFQYNYNETNVICFDKSCVEEHTLAKIPFVNGKLSLIIDENNKNPLIKIRQYNGPVNINKLDIKVLDKYGDIIDLNFMDFSFSLELEILYERNNIL